MCDSSVFHGHFADCSDRPLQASSCSHSLSEYNVCLIYVISANCYCRTLKFNPLKTKCRLGSYRAVNTFRLSYETNQFKLYGAEVAVCSEINTKHIKCGQKVQLLNVKPVGAPNQ